MQAILIILIGSLYFVSSSPCLSPSSAPYELIHLTDHTTERTGSITMKCRDKYAEDLDINEVNFFLNYSSTTNCLSLRERGDITVIAVGTTGIKFDLTREYDGFYTCRKRGDKTCTANYTTSPPKPYISLQTIVPLLPLPQTHFTATSGEKVVFHCPIQPGAFLQQYSVRWMKGSIPIAKINNVQNVMTPDDSHYQIDRGRYSLIISSVTVNDTGTDYQCELSVLNPVTNVLRVLQPSTPVTLSLKVIVNKPRDSEADSTPDNDMPTFAADSATTVIIPFLYSFFNTIIITFFIA